MVIHTQLTRRLEMADGPPHWIVGQDAEPELRALYERHYSCHHYQDGRRPKQFVGPGEHIVLTTPRRDALFVWRKFIDDSGQEGVNCAVFRNESPVLASALVREADAIADRCWPGARHYTYVRAEAVRSSNPGFCFLRAGWQRCGKTKGGLLVLERLTGGLSDDGHCKTTGSIGQIGCDQRRCPRTQRVQAADGRGHRRDQQADG